MRKLIYLLAVLFTLAGCSSKQEVSWQESPTFQIENNYTVRGEKGKVALMDIPFVAGKGNKFMWFFWGDKKELSSGKFKVVAINEKGEKVPALVEQPGTPGAHTVWEYNGLGSALYGADAHTPSSVVLPTPGLRKLEAYVGEKHRGSVIVHVK